MAELSAIEAKEAAVKEVAKLLPLPENLASIAALKADFAQRQQANDAQLSTSVMTQVEQAKAGMDVLAASQATIGELRDAFMLIDKLCTQCKNLIDHHDQINLLSHARNNLNTAIKDAEGMMSISEEAAAARASLANEKELVRTFERLNVLEGKRRFALAATGSRKAEASRLTEYFEEVSQTREMFEETLWGHIRDFFNLAQESPQTLVRCAKIVEMQEVIDAEAAREAAEAEKASTAGGDPPGTTAPPKQPRNYKTRCFSELERGVEDHFHDLLNNFIHEDLKKVLDEASAIASELPDIYDYVAPCFPPQYEIFVFMVQLYTQHFSTMLRKLGDKAQDLANIDILKVMGWIARYQEQLLALGVEESKAEILAECGAMDPLMNAYVDRMQDSMQSWLSNILEDDWSRPPKFSDEGRCWTPSAVDFFRLLGEQVATVQNNCTGIMVYKVAQAVIQVMNDFQAAERRHMDEPVMEIGLEHLCALVNNNVRCYDLAKDLSENIMHSLPDYYAEQIHFEDTCRNFLDIAKDAVHLTLKLIFEDPGVKSILQALYQNDWYQGLVTETLIETFRDYFGDIERFIEERSFRRFAEACLERTIVAYVDALLLQKNYVKEATLERMGKDEYQINDFFKAHVNEKKVEKRVQPLADLRELIMSDSSESFELNYTTLLQNHPDCPPEVVAKLVGFREDIAKADKKEVIARCQEIFQATLKDGEGPKPGLIFSDLTAIPRPKLTLKK